MLGHEVKFVPDIEVTGPIAKKAVSCMEEGDIILLENTRFRSEEEKNDPIFSRELADLCDIYVNDAFGTAHRAHCSTVGVAEYVEETAIGYLMKKEIEYLGNAVEEPERPFVAILGGAKVAEKLGVISTLLEECDTLIIGGGMAYTFIKAQGYEIGKSLLDEDKIEYCREMMEKAKRIYFFGIGDSLLTAMEARNKFLRIMDKVSCVDDPHMQAMTASMATPDDLYFIISFSGATKDTVYVADILKEVGAKMVAITRFAKSPLTTYADGVLLCGCNEGPL